MSVDAEDALLDALEQRLSRLERFIHGDNPSASSLSKIARRPGNDVSTQVAQLLKLWGIKEQQLHRVEIASEDGSSVKKQMEDYEKIEAQVDFMEEDTLDEASKVDICLEAADHAEELATLVSSFHSLKSFVNSEAIGKVSALSLELAPLETVHWELVEDACGANATYHQLLANYNDTINLLSKKFVFWDSLLRMAVSSRR